MLKTNKNVPNGKNHSSGKFLELQTYSKDSSPKLSNAKTIIGKDISIQGDIRGKEHMIIDGSVKGNIEMETHNFAISRHRARLKLPNRPVFRVTFSQKA
jgi:hypothetical protein